MFRNQAKMSHWKQETKVKKQEVQNARKFARNFAKAMRNEVVASIDITQGDFKKPKFQDKGERVQQKSKAKNVLSRTCKSSSREDQPILWSNVIQRNQWYES